MDDNYINKRNENGNLLYVYKRRLTQSHDLNNSLNVEIVECPHNCVESNESENICWVVHRPVLYHDKAASQYIGTSTISINDSFSLPLATTNTIETDDDDESVRREARNDLTDSKSTSSIDLSSLTDHTDLSLNYKCTLEHPTTLPILSLLQVNEYLVWSEDKKQLNEVDVIAGCRDALIVHFASYGCTSPSYYLFFETFLFTYRSFISSYDLINRLIQRYSYFSHPPHNLKDITTTITSDIRSKVCSSTVSAMITVVSRLKHDLTPEVSKVLFEFGDLLIKDNYTSLSRVLQITIERYLEGQSKNATDQLNNDNDNHDTISNNNNNVNSNYNNNRKLSSSTSFSVNVKSEYNDDSKDYNEKAAAIGDVYDGGIDALDHTDDDNQQRVYVDCDDKYVDDDDRKLLITDKLKCNEHFDQLPEGFATIPKTQVQKHDKKRKMTKEKKKKNDLLHRYSLTINSNKGITPFTNHHDNSISGSSGDGNAGGSNNTVHDCNHSKNTVIGNTMHNLICSPKRLRRYYLIHMDHSLGLNHHYGQQHSNHRIQQNTPLTILDFSARSVAEQLTHLEAEKYYKIELSELLDIRKLEQGKAPGVAACAQHFTTVSNWATNLVLGATNNSLRDKIANRLLDIMEHLHKLQNFSTYLSLLCAFLLVPDTIFSRKTRTRLSRVTPYMQPPYFSEYRQELAQASPPFIPYLGLMLQNLIVLAESNPLHCDPIPPTLVNKYDPVSHGPIINFWRCWKHFLIIHFIIKQEKLDSSKTKYAIKPNPAILRFFNNFEDSPNESELRNMASRLRHNIN